jgi:hypothetical protein
VHAERHGVKEGSWFRGKLYPLRCDVSFDGKFMVYLAMGASGKTWNGVCRAPWLTTFLDVENMGTWYGGDYFAGPRLWKTNRWNRSAENATHTDIAFELQPYGLVHGGEDLGRQLTSGARLTRTNPPLAVRSNAPSTAHKVRPRALQRPRFVPGPRMIHKLSRGCFACT